MYGAFNSTRDGKGVLALGTPGSYGMLQTQVQAMVGYVDFGLDVQAAIEMPRARLWDGKQIFLERRVSHSVCVELQPGAMTLFCYPIIHGALAVCGCVVTLTNGALAGAADSRRDGAAVPA